MPHDDRSRVGRMSKTGVRRVVYMYVLCLLASYAAPTISWVLPIIMKKHPSSRPTISSARQPCRMAGELSGNDIPDKSSRDRMKAIRELQEVFYSSSPQGTDAMDESPPIVEEDGTIARLPLWRVGWTELPGRSNVLIVHEARYTNMFEKIIRSPNKDWCFGHLRLPGGSSSLGKDEYRLLNWQEEAKVVSKGNEGRNGNEIAGSIDESTSLLHATNRSAVVGTLMRIIDFRRMGDGKMLLYVQAIERFVITHAVREIPYSIADVQLLADSEEIEEQLQPSYKKENDDNNEFDKKSDWWSILGEKEAIGLRSLALGESFRWRKYEFDDTIRLPIRDDDSDDITPADVVGTALRGLIPHIPFSSSIPMEKERQSETPQTASQQSFERSSERGLLEKELIESGILLGPSEPDPQRRSSFLKAEELERSLWIFVDEYVQLQGSSSSFPRELLALLPRNVNWPDNFILEDLAAAMASTSDLEESTSFERVSVGYPGHRRRKRLSYVISALTDHTPFGKGMPPILLEIHSTRDRLEACLDVFNFVNDEMMGEFN